MKNPLLILLAFNESESIEETVGEAKRVLPGMTILVVDDGSTDDTAQKALAAGAILVRHPINLGVAAAEATGLLYAVRNHHDCAVRMDGDGQHDPAFVPRFLTEIAAGHDLVVGSRFLELESFRSSRMRRFGNRFLAGILSSLCHCRITDPTSGFRAFGARSMRFFSVTFPHDYPEPESLLMAHSQGYEIREVPVKMRPRLRGTSSLTPLRSTYYMLKVSFALMLEWARTEEVQVLD